MPFPRIDLVVCRNLLIYFKPELQQERARPVRVLAAPDAAAILFLGKAETARPVQGRPSSWSTRSGRSTGASRGPIAAPPRPRRPRAAPVRGGRRAGRARSARRRTVRARPKPRSARGVNEVILRRLPIGRRGHRPLVPDRDPERARPAGCWGSASRRWTRTSSTPCAGLPYARCGPRSTARSVTAQPVTLPEVEPGAARRRAAHFISPARHSPGRRRWPATWPLITVVDATELVQTRRRLEAVQARAAAARRRS